MSNASSKAMTSSTMSSESAPKSFWKLAPEVNSEDSIPSCSPMMRRTVSSTAGITHDLLLADGKPPSVIAGKMLCKGLSLCQNEHDASDSVLVLHLSSDLLYLMRVSRKFAAKTVLLLLLVLPWLIANY